MKPSLWISAYPNTAIKAVAPPGGINVTRMISVRCLLDDRATLTRAVLAGEGIEVGYHLRPELRVAFLRLMA